MGWPYDTRATRTNRKARAAAESEIVRRKKKAILAKQSDRDARRDAVSRGIWGLRRSD